MKKQNIMLGLAAAALTVGGIYATAQSVRQLPLRAPEASAKAPAKVINDDRDLGLKMFAATAVDCQHERAFVNFHTNHLSQMNKLKTLVEQDGSVSSTLFELHTGCFTPSGYFGMLAKAYTLKIYAHSWIKVNTNTGDYETLQNYWEDDASYSSDYWEGTYDMSFNYNDGKVYGIYGRVDPADGIAKSALATVDLATGKVTKVKDLDYYYFCIAIDYDGIPYGIRWYYDLEDSDEILGSVLVRFTKDWEIDDEWEVKLDGSSFKPNYVHTMEFDHSTGDLYWGGTGNDARQAFVKFTLDANKDLTKTERLGSVGFGEVINGLYIPFTTADSRTAPARVKDINFTPCTDGSNECTISWTNPTLQWNKKPLTGIDGVLIFRDQTMSELAEVPATGMGEAQSYVDKTATPGLHTYYVGALDKDGNLGVLDSINAFIGRDVPGKVQSVKSLVSSDGTKVTLAWKKPAAGSKDGWYDTTGLKYRIVRMPDNVVLEEGKADDGKANQQYVDNPVNVERYSYIITASNNDGVGTETYSDEILAGKYMQVPYTTDFSDKKDANRWEGLGHNGNGSGISFAEYEDGSKMFRILPSGRFDETLVSPAFNIEKDKNYKVTFTVGFVTFGKRGEDDDDYVLNLVAGTDKENMPIQFTQEYTAPASDDITKTFDFYFTGAETERTYFGLNITAETTDNIYIKGASIEQEFDNDMSAVSLTAPYEIGVGADAEFTAVIHNNGRNPQSKYKVQICYNNDILLGETENVPTIASRKDANVKLKFKVPDGAQGEQNVYARVILDGDQNSSNDRSVKTGVSVLEDNTLAVNKVIFGTEETHISTVVPMYHYSPSSLTQTIYPADEHKIKEVSYIHRLGWEYNAQRDVNGTKLTIALGLEDKTTKTSSSDWSSQREVVYTGMVNFKEGRHYLVVDLPKSFKVQPGKSLVVTVAKYDEANAGDFPIDFPTYGHAPSMVNYEDMDRVHSVKSHDSAEQNIWGNGTKYIYWLPEAPKFVMAVNQDEIYSDVEETVAFQSAVYYDADSRMVRTIGVETAYAEVYGMQGNRVFVKALAADEDAFALDLQKGVYVVRVTEKSGKAHIAKIFVK